MTHKSDCVTNNMPAMPAGHCDCGYLVTVRREDLRDILWKRESKEARDAGESPSAQSLSVVCDRQIAHMEAAAR